ncbi:MAG: ArsR/SmtB family transcription factor [Erysipelotrichaceae bacterium]
MSKLTNSEYQRLAEIFKKFASTPRLKILIALSESEKNVSELIEICDLSQSATSHQLKTLKEGRLVKSRRVSSEVLYSLDDQHVFDILKIAIDHVIGHCE